MTNIYCSCRDCLWRDSDDGMCMRMEVEVSEDGCLDYSCILYHPEYQEKFWIACGDREKPTHRVEKTGKKIEYRGRVFYTTEQVNHRENFKVTDAITGADCGTFTRVKNNFDKFLAKAAEYPDVMSYPPAVLVDGRLIPIGEEQEEQPTVVSSEEFTGILDSLKQMYGGG